MLSVIVCFYNEERYLRLCIESIISQTYRDLEIILIDDGSTDASGEIAEEFRVRDKRIKVVHQKNKGLVASRKIGISLAHGDYIAYVDADDWIDRDRFLTMYEKGMMFDADIVSSDVVAEYGNGESEKYLDEFEGLYQGDRLKEVLENRIDTEHFFVNYQWGGMCKHIYKNSLIKKIQLMIDDRITMMEGSLCHSICMLNADCFSAVKGAVYHYRKDKRSMSTTAVEKNNQLCLVYDTLYSYMYSYNLNQRIIRQMDFLMYEAVLLSEYDSLMRDTSLSLFPYRDIKPNSRLVVYGSGAFGRQIISFLLKTKYAHLVMVCSSDFGHEIEVEDTNIKIQPPENLLNAEYDCIAVAVMHYEVTSAIVQSLANLGIDMNKIRTVDNVDVMTHEYLEETIKHLRKADRFSIDT